MCVDEEHVRALADQAAEWHKPGMKPVGSAGRSPERELCRLTSLFRSGHRAYREQAGLEIDVEE